jgi:hypothetical protein
MEERGDDHHSCLTLTPVPMSGATQALGDAEEDGGVRESPNAEQVWGASPPSDPGLTRGWLGRGGEGEAHARVQSDSGLTHG